MFDDASQLSCIHRPNASARIDCTSLRGWHLCTHRTWQAKPRHCGHHTARLARPPQPHECTHLELAQPQASCRRVRPVLWCPRGAIGPFGCQDYHPFRGRLCRGYHVAQRRPCLWPGLLLDTPRASGVRERGGQSHPARTGA